MMETVIFIVVMVLVHALMMYFMAGMHGRHSHVKNGMFESKSVKEENRKLKEEIHVLKSEVRRNER